MKFLYFSILVITFYSCDVKNRKIGNAKFDGLISKLEINPDTLLFDEMSKIVERTNIFDTTAILKTSNIEYCKTNNTNDNPSYNCISDYECNAILNDDDTLIIQIDNFNGYSGDGFKISYRSGKFYIQPYTVTHNDLGNIPLMNVEIKQQQLVLNKEKYAVGDSLYGKIYFHLTGTEYGELNDHFVQGYFRAKVEKRPVNY